MNFASVHDAWLYGLGNSGGRVGPEEGLDGPAGPGGLDGLAKQVREWQRKLLALEGSPFKLCFRLEEPQDSSDIEDQWFVRFLLQSRQDPSLILAAADVWQHKSLPALQATSLAEVREYTLTALGRAAALCPEMATGLDSPAPEGYGLDNAGAYTFLIGRAGVLEDAGFGVMLPAWWSRKGTVQRLKVKAQVKSPKFQGGGALSLQEITQIDWQTALGDEVLDLAELKTLADMKAPLVKFRGQWVEVRSGELQAALEFWRKKKHANFTARDVIQLALGRQQSTGPLEVAGVAADGWLGELLEQLQGKRQYEEVAPPAELQGTLRPYQSRGFAWLAFLSQFGLGACLADDMGLGKTIQTLALIQHNRTKGEKCPVLLVCPTSLLGNWYKEAARFTPELSVLIHHGTDRLSGQAWEEAASNYALVLTSYGLLQRDWADFNSITWAGIILDEAQNIKNAETRQAKAARNLPAAYRLALTGTPVENNVGDLWSLMEFLNPGLLGGQSEFKRNFFLPTQAGGDQEAAARLKKLTSPFILRRLKSDKSIISDLPEKLEMKVYCTLTKEQASLYQSVVNQVEAQLEGAAGMERRGLILSTLAKLKQLCNHPAHFLKDNSSLTGRSGKLARLTEMLEEVVANGEKALIFTQFAEMGELLKRHLQDNFGVEVPFLHGAVAKQERDRMVERFQTGDAALPLFILSLKAGGTGLNLTAANHVFHFDRWWNPAVENQASDRAYRIGQTKNVQVHKFLCVGTLEEKIDGMISKKQEVAEQVVGSGEGWLTELSTSDLKELFALSQEAVR